MAHVTFAEFVFLLGIVVASLVASTTARFPGNEVGRGPLGTGCQCVMAKYNCGCCATLDIPKIRLNETGCVNVTYLPDQYGVSLTFQVNGRTIINETVSAKNPPPICVGVPYLEKEASLCVDFYNLDITKSAFSGCIKIEARLVHVLVEDVKLGCFRIPLKYQDVPHVASLIRSLETLYFKPKYMHVDRVRQIP